MVQKIHPQGVIWVPSFRLMWADHQKELTVVPSIKDIGIKKSMFSLTPLNAQTKYYQWQC